MPCKTGLFGIIRTLSAGKKCVSVNLSVENVFDWMAIDRSFKMRLNV